MRIRRGLVATALLASLGFSAGVQAAGQDLSAKQQGVVTKVLALVNKPSPSLAGDLRTASRILKPFRKGFRGIVNDCFRGSFDVEFTNGNAAKRVQGAFDLSKLPAL